MVDRFEHIKKMYEESFNLHGDSPASLLTPKGRCELRFRAIDELVAGRKVSILDYGCGLGYLYEYLIKAGHTVEYTGVDILPSFIKACCQKYPNHAKFRVIKPTTDIEGEFDVVFSSGVFNIKTNNDEETSKNYAFRKLEQLFTVTRQVLVCDFLSPFVDFQQTDSQHFSIDEVTDFCARQLTRRFILRHDLLPYEFTLIAHRKSEIKRPENIYKVDSGKRSLGDI